MPETATAYVIIIPDFHPPSLNQLMRGRRRDRIRLAKECRNMVSVYASIVRVPPATGPRRVTLTITLEPGQRGCDPDGYTKGISDAMVAACLLRDDNRQNVEWAPVVFRRGDRKMTTITLEDMET